MLSVYSTCKCRKYLLTLEKNIATLNNSSDPYVKNKSLFFHGEILFGFFLDNFSNTGMCIFCTVD